MAILLIGMGIDKLSVDVADVHRIKWLVRSFTMDRARALTADALTQEHTTDIRKMLEDAVKEAGLEDLIKTRT